MTATEHALEITRIAARAASDKLGTDIVAYDVSDRLAITDVFLVVTASNERQVGAVVDGIEEALLARRVKPLRREGDRENRWVLLDFSDVVVHVQHTEERHLYALERLWRDCPEIALRDLTVTAESLSDESSDDESLSDDSEFREDDGDAGLDALAPEVLPTAPGAASVGLRSPAAVSDER